MHPVNPNLTAVTTTTLTSQPGNQPENTPNASEVVRQWIERTAFALLADGLGSKNSVVLSPVSIAPVLGMLLAGMEDQTKKETLLGLSPGSLTAELETRIHQELGTFSRTHPFTDSSMLATINFLVSKRQCPAQEVIDTLKDAYHTELQLVDPMDNVADTTDKYVSHKTEGRITNAFGDLSARERTRTVLALGSVLNFQGTWAESFDESATHPGNFCCQDGSIIGNVEMMNWTGRLKLVKCHDFSAVAKPFKSSDGQPLELVAIQPGSNSTSLIDLNNSVINDLINLSTNASEVGGCLTLPRIEIKHTDQQLLKKLTSATGYEITSQDLGRLHLSADDTLHSHSTVNVSLDEKGVRGSVVSIARAQTRAAGRQPVFTFDSPGYIAIVDSSGNRLLEAVISDGQFLATRGPAAIMAPPSGPSGIDARSDDPHLNALSESCEPVIINSKEPTIKTEHPAITKNSPDLVALLKNRLGPGGGLDNFRNLSYGDNLRLEFKSSHEAETLQARIVQLIGKKHADTVRLAVFEVSNTVDVILSVEGTEQLRRHLTEHDNEPPGKPVVSKKGS